MAGLVSIPCLPDAVARSGWLALSVLLLVGCHQPRTSNPSPEVTAEPTAVPAEAKAEPELVQSEVVIEDWLELQPGLRVSRQRREVEFEAEICLDDGWLEQIICGPGTREHESIMVTRIPASSIHAALLAAGFEPGVPGRWASGIRVPPSGSPLDIQVSAAGSDEQIPVRTWIRGVDGEMPEGGWVFGGSLMRPEGSVPEGVSLYEADLSGSIVGLVTFGDETIGFQEVIPDLVDIHPEEWRVGSVPPVGTVIRVLVRSADD